MLTPQDLEAIGNVVDERLDKRFKEYDKKMNEKFEQKFSEFEKKIDQKLDYRFKKELTPIKRELRRIRKDMDVIVRFFDNEITGANRRIDRLEDYLNLSRIS